VPEDYNNYVVKFPESIRNVRSFELVSYDVPQNENNITNTVNKLLINKECLEYEPGQYTIDEILNVINTMDEYGAILIGRRVKIYNKNGESFTMKRIKGSITVMLGFNNSEYSGSHEYIGESDYNLDISDEVELYLNDMENLFGILDMKKKSMKGCKIDFVEPIKEFSGLIIRFMDKRGLYDFENKPHVLKFLFHI
jgi:hypothetical protein